MKQSLSDLRALNRSIPWQGKAHRFFWWLCAVCLSVYLAYALFLSQSGLFLSAADTAAALCWFAAIACGVFAGLYAWSGLRGGKVAPDARGRLNLRVFLLSAGICLLILGVYLMANFPGGVTVDSAVQWTQAATGRYSNWHPVFHTLLLRLGYLLKPQYAFVVALQCGVFSAAVGYLVATLHAWGIKLWPLLAAQALLVASPIVGHTLMYLWKDNAMTIGVTLLFAQGVNLYFSRGAWLAKARNGLAFGLALAFTTLVRHNALLFTLPMAVCAAILYRKQAVGALTSAVVLAAALWLVWGPLYGALNVSYPHNTLEESIGVPMTVISNVRKQNPAALDAETLAFTDRMADQAGWDRYVINEYNSIKFGDTRGAVAHATLAQILRMAANTAKADPRNAFLAVNGVTDLVWGLGDEGSANVTVRNSGDLPSVPKQAGGINRIGAAAQALIAAPVQLSPVAWYFGNLGVPLALMLLAALRALRRNGLGVLLLCLPTLLYSLGTMCVLCGSDARFFAFSPLVCTFALFVLARDVRPLGETSVAKVNV